MPLKLCDYTGGFLLQNMSTFGAYTLSGSEAIPIFIEIHPHNSNKVQDNI